MSENPNPEIRTDEQPGTATTPAAGSEPTVPTKPAETPEQAIARLTAERDEARTKFGESSREAQILGEKLKSLEGSSRRELTNEPTESDLRAAFPEWDSMQGWEKEAARRSFNADRIARSLAAEREQDRQRQQWNTDVEVFIAANPVLQDRSREFHEFANKPSHRGAPLDVLKDAFLQRNTSTPTTTMTPTPQTPASEPAAPGLESGNGGPRTPDQPKQLSADELKTLRQTDERAYNNYVRTHDIDIDQLA
jgi:hypothetical protein